MSIIVRKQDGTILLMTKGADSHIVPRLREGPKELIDYTEKCLSEFAEDGLRTLILA